MESETEKPAKCACGCKCKKFAAAIIFFLIAGVACWYIHHPNRPRPSIGPIKPGTICTVQFRQDALARQDGSGISRPISMVGELIAVTHEAILLDQVNDRYVVNDVPQMKRYWVPKSSILSIEYEPARTFLDLPQENILRIRYEATHKHKEGENHNHAEP